MKIRVDHELTDKQVVIALAKADNSGFAYANPKTKAKLLAVLRAYLRENGAPWEDLGSDDEVGPESIRKALLWAETLGLRLPSLRVIRDELMDRIA